MGFVDFNNDGDTQQCTDIGSNVTCNVYDPEQLKPVYDQHNYSLLHLNIRSLSKHYDDLTSLLTTTGCSFDIIGCSESWLNDYSCVDLFNLDGYTLHLKNRPNRRGGGVCLYVKNSLFVKVCDFDIDDDHSESLFIEINTKDKNLIVGVIYRPPDSIFYTFRGKLENLLHKLNKSNKDCIILGDFNLDISKNDAAKHDFINTMHSSSFFPTINTFTRVTQTSSSIIDNFITNIRNTMLVTGVVRSDITDHFPIAFFYGSAKMYSIPHPKTKKCKIINEITLQLLNANLLTKPWETIYNCTTPDAAYDNLIKYINDSIEVSIPVKSVRCRTTAQNPWITKGIVKSIKHKNKLYKCYLTNPSTETKKKYSTYRNKLTHIIRKSKSNHYTELLNSSRGDCKRMWKVLSGVLNKGCKPIVLPVTGDIEEDLPTNFNNYFVSIGENLAATIRQPQGYIFNNT